MIHLSMYVCLYIYISLLQYSHFRIASSFSRVFLLHCTVLPLLAGFENFFPKGAAGKPKTSKSGSSKDTKGSSNGTTKETKESSSSTNQKKESSTTSTSFGNFGKNSQKRGSSGGSSSGSGGGGGGSGQDNTQLGGLTALALVALALRAALDDESTNGGREVSLVQSSPFLLFWCLFGTHSKT